MEKLAAFVGPSSCQSESAIVRVICRRASESPGRRAQVPGRAAVWLDLDSLIVTVEEAFAPSGFNYYSIFLSRRFESVESWCSYRRAISMDRAFELGVACQVPNMPANSRSTPRQLPAPAGFTGGLPPNLPGRVSPAAAASLRSGYKLAPRRGHLRAGPIRLIGARSPRFFSAVCCNWDRCVLAVYHGASTCTQARGETSLW